MADASDATANYDSNCFATQQLARVHGTNYSRRPAQSTAEPRSVQLLSSLYMDLEKAALQAGRGKLGGSKLVLFYSENCPDCEVYESAWNQIDKLMRGTTTSLVPATEDSESAEVADAGQLAALVKIRAKVRGGLAMVANNDDKMLFVGGPAFQHNEIPAVYWVNSFSEACDDLVAQAEEPAGEFSEQSHARGLRSAWRPVISDNSESRDPEAYATVAKKESGDGHEGTCVVLRTYKFPMQLLSDYTDGKTSIANIGRKMLHFAHRHACAQKSNSSSCAAGQFLLSSREGKREGSSEQDSEAAAHGEGSHQDHGHIVRQGRLCDPMESAGFCSISPREVGAGGAEKTRKCRRHCAS